MNIIYNIIACQENLKWDIKMALSEKSLHPHIQMNTWEVLETKFTVYNISMLFV
jgi:hypothetical protein